MIEELQKQVAELQAHPDSYQSGFDDGRASVMLHANRWKEYGKQQWAMRKALEERVLLLADMLNQLDHPGVCEENLGGKCNCGIRSVLEAVR